MSGSNGHDQDAGGKKPGPTLPAELVEKIAALLKDPTFKPQLDALLSAEVSRSYTDFLKKEISRDNTAGSEMAKGVLRAIVGIVGASVIIFSAALAALPEFYDISRTTAADSVLNLMKKMAIVIVTCTISAIALQLLKNVQKFNTNTIAAWVAAIAMMVVSICALFSMLNFAYIPISVLSQQFR